MRTGEVRWKDEAEHRPSEIIRLTRAAASVLFDNNIESRVSESATLMSSTRIKRVGYVAQEDEVIERLETTEAEGKTCKVAGSRH